MNTSLGQSNDVPALAVGNVVVKFGAVWCAPCKTYHSVWQAFAQMAPPDVRAVEVDIDAHPGAAQAAFVRAVPTTIAIRNGVIIARKEGVLTLQDLQQMTLAARG